ncbi:hypothetical protein CU097_011064 [Rhizopus azygosporus]|uniref:Uncharacterized protein n=1 Tax=Rhizopus azygosporus TaxID=86630 RepID=A0A367JNP5_RHIAZ|nr:hypothetical protein G6F71_000712 [Rhizopus microsporus]RCH91564.1 hypothetical protein CU097_011064 [Rhizopus azygosporus]
MTAEYSLLEQQTPRQTSKKRWHALILAIGIISVTSYLIYFTRSNYIDSFEEEEGMDQNLDLSDSPSSNKSPTNNSYIPNRNINFTVPTQKEPYYIDLDKYPVEDNMLIWFPGSRGMIETVTINKLLKKSVPWTEQWLDHTTHPSSDTFACARQPIPYPILRHIVAEYVPSKDSDDFFEDNSINLNEPFVLLPFSNQSSLHQGDQLCIRLIVPYRPIDAEDPHRFLYKPYPRNNQDLTYPWWDTAMVWLQDLKTNASLPIQMQPWSGHRLLRTMARMLNHVSTNLPEWARLREDELYERMRMRIYEAQITLPQEGEYKLFALLEFLEGRYNFEYGPVTPYAPIELPVLPTQKLLIGDRNNDDPEKLAEKLLDEHLQLTLCTGSDHPGRWLPWPKSRKQVQVLGLTRHGKYWAPYSCRYRHITYEQFNRCVAHKYSRGMDMYGDSNIRRSLKKFISHGHWCKNWENHITESIVPDDLLPNINKTLTHSLDKRQATLPTQTMNQSEVGYSSPQEYKYFIPEQTRSCYCEDYTEPFWQPVWFDAGGRRVNVDMNNTIAQSKGLGHTEWDDPEIRKRNPRDAFKISSYKWDGLTYLNNPPWQTAVDGNTVATDVAVFSLGNWDAAFLELEPYLRDVDRLILQIKTHYDLSKTRIVYRTPQFYCCRVDHSSRDRQVSGPRVDVFDAEVRHKFVSELNATVWDTRILGESKTWEEKLESIDCPSNHVAADIVDIENQIFMNGLCNNV